MKLDLVFQFRLIKLIYFGRFVNLTHLFFLPT